MSGKIILFSNAIEGRENEFNRWYDERHLPDILAVPRVIDAQRFRVQGDEARRYLAIYDIDGADPAAVFAEIQARAATSKIVMSDSLDVNNVAVSLVEKI